MPYDSKAVANYLLKKAESEGKALTPLQLIKLVYFAYGWHLAITGKPLLREHIQAWQWGPVVPDLYHEFKRFGGGPITSHAKDFDWLDGDGFDVTIPQLPEDESTAATRAVLDRVWTLYSKFSGGQLMAMTHQTDTPWDIVWNKEGGKERRNTEIRDELLKDYFSGLLHKHKAPVGVGQ